MARQEVRRYRWTCDECGRQVAEGEALPEGVLSPIEKLVDAGSSDHYFEGHREWRRLAVCQACFAKPPDKGRRRVSG